MFLQRERTVLHPEQAMHADAMGKHLEQPKGKRRMLLYHGLEIALADHSHPHRCLRHIPIPCRQLAEYLGKANPVTASHVDKHGFASVMINGTTFHAARLNLIQLSKTESGADLPPDLAPMVSMRFPTLRRPLSVFNGRHVVQRAVRADMVVLSSPQVDFDPRFVHGPEPLAV